MRRCLGTFRLVLGVGEERDHVKAREVRIVNASCCSQRTSITRLTEDLFSGTVCACISRTACSSPTTWKTRSSSAGNSSNRRIGGSPRVAEAATRSFGTLPGLLRAGLPAATSVGR